MLSRLLNGSDPKRYVTPAGAADGGLGSRPKGASSPAAGPVPAVPDPEMTVRATRRRFTNAYKLAIIDEVDAATDRGHDGALLRREGLYYSTLAKLRKQKAQGLLSGPDSAVAKPRASKDPAVLAAIAQQTELERENRKLRRQLAHAQRIIAIQKKAAILLGETLQNMTVDETD